MLFSWPSGGRPLPGFFDAEGVALSSSWSGETWPGETETATDKRVRECHVEPDQEVLFAYADRTFADSHLANIDSLLGSDSWEKQANMF